MEEEGEEETFKIRCSLLEAISSMNIVAVARRMRGTQVPRE